MPSSRDEERENPAIVLFTIILLFLFLLALSTCMTRCEKPAYAYTPTTSDLSEGDPR